MIPCNTKATNKLRIIFTSVLELKQKYFHVKIILHADGNVIKALTPHLHISSWMWYVPSVNNCEKQVERVGLIYVIAY